MTMVLDSPKDLYSAVPPTKLRNREEKQRKAKNIPFWHFVGDRVFHAMLKNRFYSLMYQGEENFEQRDKRYATIFYATHNNWWDGIVGYNVIYNLFKKDKLKLRLMIEEMNRFPLFQYVGCFPVNKKSAQSAMKSLQYAATTLEDPSVGFWLFPQGIIRPPHYRPEIFQQGLAYLTKEAVKSYGGINLIPVSVNYTFLRQDRPEVVLDFGKVETIMEHKFDRKEFTQSREREFERFCEGQQHGISQADFNNYKYLFKRKLSWYRDIEQRLKAIGMRKSSKTEQ